MKKDRLFSADKELTLVGMSHDSEFDEVRFVVEVEDKGETRMFQMFFDLEEVLQKGVELVQK